MDRKASVALSRMASEIFDMSVEPEWATMLLNQSSVRRDPTSASPVYPNAKRPSTSTALSRSSSMTWPACGPLSHVSLPSDTWKTYSGVTQLRIRVTVTPLRHSLRQTGKKTGGFNGKVCGRRGGGRTEADPWGFYGKGTDALSKPVPSATRPPL